MLGVAPYKANYVNDYQGSRGGKTIKQEHLSKMAVYSFYIFDRHGVYRNSEIQLMLILDLADCIYKKKWAPRPTSSSTKAQQSTGPPDGAGQPKALSAEDDAKLIFGTIFSLRNMVRKLGGPEDK